MRAATQDDLADRFAVSRMTIHRDPDDLERAGMRRKIRGGATIRAGTRFEIDFRVRAMQAAMALVEPGMTLIVNDGSMAVLLAGRLVKKRPLTVITNSAAIDDHLRDQPGITLMALGGTYSPKYNVSFGGNTENSLSRIRADIDFISIPAVLGGAFHVDDEVVRTKRTMKEAAALQRTGITLTIAKEDA